MFIVLYYGVVVWTLKKTETIKIFNSFETWVYRISWVDKITNKEVLIRMGKEREVELTVKEKNLQYMVIKYANYYTWENNG